MENGLDKGDGIVEEASKHSFIKHHLIGNWSGWPIRCALLLAVAFRRFVKDPHAFGTGRVGVAKAPMEGLFLFFSFPLDCLLHGGFVGGIFELPGGVITLFLATGFVLA